MVRIADGQNIPGNFEAGGARFGLSALLRPQAEPQKPNMLESIEHILSNPVMQPVVQQGARLIAAYADKLTIENNEKIQKAQAQQTPGEIPRQVLFGEGAPQP